MYFHMPGQCVLASKTLLTLIALISLHFCVNEHVFVESTTLAEGSATLFTCMILLSSMNKQVPDKITTPSKGLVAYVARIWLFTCVHAFVCVEMAMLPEGFATIITCMILLPSMNKHVCVEIGTTVK